MPSVTSTSPEYFPPYGHMIWEWEKLTFEHKQPDHWASATDYDDWREGIVELLSAVLWPRYLPKERRWAGHATTLMHDLTKADFGLFPSLRPLIDADAGIGGGVKHLALFHLEDEQDVKDDNGTVIKDLNVDAALRKYLSGVASPEHVEDLAANYIPRLAAKAGTIDLELKVDMQRPRPFQMSWIMDIDFSHRRAKSALTPAMISGHCFEMMMGGLAAYVRALELGCAQPALDAIAQHTVDSADRRVFAGVHYPSDNISSWITGLLACPYLAVGSSERHWLWRSIQSRSVVYREIEAAIRNGGGDAFVPSMDLLRAIGEGEIATIEEALARNSGAARVAA